MTQEENKNFQTPDKKETLAVKAEERNNRHFTSRFSQLSSQWWVGVGEALGVTALLLVNFFLLYPFWGQPDQMNVFSAPLIPTLVAVTERLVPFSYGVRIWLLAFLIFFPLSFYFFVREISGRKLIGFLSAFIVSLPVGIFLPARVNLGLLSEDGAHIASLTFVPLVCLCLLGFLRQGHFWLAILAALGATLVALTSPLGSLILLVFMVVVTFSEVLLGQGRLKAMRFLVIFLLAVGFSAFWYNPKFVLLTIFSPEGQLARQTFSNLLPLSFFLFPILGVFGFLLFENRAHLQTMFIAFFLTAILRLFSLGAGVAHPFPSRFLPAFGISLAFFLATLFVKFFDILRIPGKLRLLKISSSLRGMIAYGLLGLVVLAVVFSFVFFARSLWELGLGRQVLGLTNEQIVGVWEVREQTSHPESLAGYIITALTVLGVIILKARLRMR